MTEAWRRYTDSELELQYNNRARVPEHPQIIDRWRRRSADYRRQHPGARLDLAYGPAAGERLDWFPAPGDAPGPLHVFIHGGYWQTLDKADFSFIAQAFNANGVHCALLNYDLCPAVDLDTIVRQIGRALAWLWLKADSLGVDPERIQVSGHSAGAQLATLSLCNHWADFDERLPEQPLHSVIAISGIYELHPLIGTSIDEVLQLTEASASRNSPLLRTPGAHAHLLIAVGAHESEEFLRQAQSLRRCWSQLQPDIEILPGRDHFTVVDAFADQHGLLLGSAMRMLNLEATAEIA